MESSKPAQHHVKLSDEPGSAHVDVVLFLLLTVLKYIE